MCQFIGKVAIAFGFGFVLTSVPVTNLIRSQRDYNTYSVLSAEAVEAIVSEERVSIDIDILSHFNF